MKKIFVCLLLAFLLTGECLADKNSVKEKSKIPPLSMTIDKYQKDGYTLLFGPAQYLERKKGLITTYRHKPVAFRSMDIVNEKGEDSLLIKYDFIYIMKKNSKIIVIKVKREARDDV